MSECSLLQSADCPTDVIVSQSLGSFYESMKIQKQEAVRQEFRWPDSKEEDLSEKVRREVEKLPAPERDFIWGYYFDGKSYRETALALGISARQAMKLHHRAKRKLRGLLAHLNQKNRHGQT